MSDIRIVNKESVISGARPGPSDHGAWLAQLESAQWQQRLRYQGGAGQPRPDGAAPEGAPQAPAPARQAPAAAPGQDAQRVRQGGDARGPAAQDAPAGARTLPGPGAPAQPRPLAGLAAPVFQQVRSGQGAEHGQPSPAPRRAVALEWQAQHAHALAGPEGIRMWLRDARYRKGDGCRLLRELRGQFARLGLRLAEFTLNGERITPSDEPVNPTTDSFQRGE